MFYVVGEDRIERVAKYREGLNDGKTFLERNIAEVFRVPTLGRRERSRFTGGRSEFRSPVEGGLSAGGRREQKQAKETVEPSL